MRGAASLLLPLCCCVVLAAEDFEPSEVTLIHPDGREEVIWLTAADIDVVHFKLGEDVDARSKVDQIVQIVYPDEIRIEPRFARYRRAMGKEDYQDAAKHAAEIIERSRYRWTAILGYFKRAEALTAGQQVDEAVATLDALVKRFPRSAAVVDALFQKGVIYFRADRHDEALKACEALGNRAKQLEAFENVARGQAARGRGMVYRARDQHAEAAKALASALDQLEADEAPDAFGEVALDLGRAQVATGQKDAALETFRAAFYLPGRVDLQAQAHLEAAKVLAEQDRVAAFDHAAIAAVRGGGQPGVRRDAANLATSLARQLFEDDSLNDQQRLEYKRYPQRF